MIPIRDLNPVRTTPWVTWAIILACSLVYIWQAILPDAVQRDLIFAWGLVPLRLVQSPDPMAVATIFTSMFMHGGLLHAAGNLWFLHIFGDNIEDNLGHGRFLVFYLLSGIAAAVTQVAVDPTSQVPMVGASGAIAGVLAAYLVLYPRARVVALVPIFIFIQYMQIPAVVFIALWFVYQFFSGVGSLGAQGLQGGVAYWAHIGGFAAGLVLIFILRRPPTRRAPEEYEYRPPDEYRGRRRPPPYDNW